MAQAPKKPAAKAANTNAKSNVTAISAVESARQSAESAMKAGTDTLKEFFAGNAEEAQKVHDKMFAVARENAEHFSRAVEKATRTMGDIITLSRENADAVVEVNHIAADIAKSINAELTGFANENFADNLEICKEAFSCHNINDALDIHTKWLSTNMDNFFNQSSRIADMVFQLATEAAEPINERVVEATERLNKTLAAAA